MSEVDFDKYFAGKKVEDLGRSFYANFGLPVDDILKNSDLYERKGKYQHAFETDIDRLGDIRVMLNIKDNHEWMSTMLHELGHGVYSKNERRDLPFLLRSEAHIFLTEGIAELMERQADNADWLHLMVGVDDKEKERIREAGKENLRMKELIFCRWTQVMVRFERGMYQNPDQNLNKLWWDLVSEYQLIKCPEGRNEPDWAAKIHLAQVPVYYHNYQLGRALCISDSALHCSANIKRSVESRTVVCKSSGNRTVSKRTRLRPRRNHALGRIGALCNRRTPDCQIFCRRIREMILR